MLNMMFIDDFIIEAAEKFEMDIEQVLDIFEEIGDELMREPTKEELEAKLSA